MSANSESDRRQVMAAALGAGLVMLVFGLGYRVLAARLDAPLNQVPVSQGALDRLPMQLGNWTGQEVPVEEEIVRATDTDAHVSRRYTKGVGFESISLWMASGVRARDLMPHRPEVCYTGAGWTLMGRRSMELPLSADEKLPCNVMQFSRGALNSEGVMVLDYYVVDGQYCADISLLRSRAWRGGGAVGYVAQVQIVTSVPSADSAESALKLVSDFAVESSPAIVRLFETSQEARPGEGDRESSGRQ